MSLILNDLWNKESIWTVSKTYNLQRGTIHSFLSRTASHASSILRFTEVNTKFNYKCEVQDILFRFSKILFNIYLF